MTGREREGGERERKRELPPDGSFPQMAAPVGAGPSQSWEPRTPPRSPTWQGHNYLDHMLPAQVHISREQDGKWSSLDSNQCSNKGSDIEGGSLTYCTTIPALYMLLRRDFEC